MYIPLNPIKLDECWEKLYESLKSRAVTSSIHNGKKITSAIPKNESLNNIKKIIHSMKQADYVRLGSNRTSLLPPHFAIEFLNHNEAKLVELVSSDSSDDTLRNDITLVIQFAFFDNEKLMKLIIPSVIDGISEPDIEIKMNKGSSQMIIQKITQKK